jgi:hypothetical protein
MEKVTSLHSVHGHQSANLLVRPQTAFISGVYWQKGCWKHGGDDDNGVQSVEPGVTDKSWAGWRYPALVCVSSAVHLNGQNAATVPGNDIVYTGILANKLHLEMHIY